VASRLDRHLEYLIDTRVRRAGGRAVRPVAVTQPSVAQPAPEFNWRDYAIMLLHAAAEIEHSLMVEYLFAAYSLGGPQVPERLERSVRQWQEIILGIAKEEMGHLVTVQNVLIAMGAPINLNRQEYPWGSEFYPFLFSLQRLSLNSLAKYVLAESPPSWHEPPLSDDIKKRAKTSAHEPVNHVGVLYGTLIDLLQHPEIPDSAFQPQSLPLQASWDTWGRGYTRGQRGQEAGNVPEALAPELVILRAISRDTAVFALQQISEQGEGPVGPRGRRSASDGSEDSHFLRFKRIYREVHALPARDQQQMARLVADNPVTQKPTESQQRIWTILHREDGRRPDEPWTHYILDGEARSWGHFFNLRYRMLLVNLAHSMHPIPLRSDEIPVVDRGIVINRTFAEMYNLRVIAGILLQLPIDPAHPDGARAGPPFEMPYTLDMPGRESNRWRLQLDLLEAAKLAIDELRPRATAGSERFLASLSASDQSAIERIQMMLSGQALTTLDERPA
jgi:hypothetical protein